MARSRRGATPRRGRWLGPALPWVTTIAILAVQEIVARSGAVPEEIPPFTVTLAAVGQLLATGSFWASLGTTMVQFLAGLSIGVAVGIALGVLLGTLRPLYLVARYVLDFLRFIPSVVYLPVLILLLGARPQLSITLTALGAVWPMLFQTFYGVAGVPPVLRETGRVFGLTTRQRLRHIVLPSVSPFMATGLRIAASHSLIVVIAIQIITAVPGLGRDIAVVATNAVYPEMYALVGIVGVIGLALNAGLERLERRQLHWHSSYREEAA